MPDSTMHLFLLQAYLSCSLTPPFGPLPLFSYSKPLLPVSPFHLLRHLTAHFNISPNPSFCLPQFFCPMDHFTLPIWMFGKAYCYIVRFPKNKAAVCT